MSTLENILPEVAQGFADGQASGENLVKADLDKLENSFNIKPGPAETLLRYIAKLKAANAPRLPALQLLAVPLLSCWV